MKKRISIWALTAALCLLVCTVPALASGTDAYGTQSDFESSWELEGLYDTGVWTGNAQTFVSYAEYPMELPVYFVHADTLMTATQDNYYDLRMAQEALWAEYGLDYDAGLEVDMSRVQCYDVEEYGPSAHMQGSVYVLHPGVYTCYRDIAYETPDCVIVALDGSTSGSAEDDYTVTDSAGNVFTLDKPYVDAAADEVSGIPEYVLQPDTTVTAPDGISFHTGLSYSLITENGGGGELGEEDRRSVTLKAGYAYEYVTDAGSRIHFRIPPINPFTDVAEGAYYYNPALWAAQTGITTGTTATTFSPNETCTRAQIITFLWRFSGSPEPGSETPYFTDVTDPSLYYYKACQWAAEAGVASGSQFHPGDPCTRAMAMEFLWYKFEKPTVDRELTFTDVPAGASYAGAVAWALDWGITTGTTDATFSPDQTCTRAQIVTFFFRSLW